MAQIHGSVLTWCTDGRSFLPFYVSVLEMGQGSLWPQGCPFFHLFIVLVKAINSKDEVERWQSDVKVEGQIKN